MSLSHTLESFLEDHHASYRIQRHTLALSSLGTARAAHIDEHTLAKSVLLEDEQGVVLAVLPASRRLELAQLRDQLGRSLRFSHEQDIELFFPDCEPGAMPPLGAAYGLPTVIDRSLEAMDEVFFEGGDHETLVQMDGQEFLGLQIDATRGEIASESETWMAARAVRERLYGSVRGLSEAIDAPIGRGPRWRRRVRRELIQLHSALGNHVRVTEGVSGLLSEIEDQAPRLARDVDVLRREHLALDAECAQLLQRVDDQQPLVEIRRSALTLLGRFATHRHHGADLVYEAFGVDIGGG